METRLEWDASGTDAWGKPIYDAPRNDRPVLLSGELHPIPHRAGAPYYGVMQAGDVVLLHDCPASGGGIRLARVTRQKEGNYYPHIETMEGEPSGFNDYGEEIVGFFREK